MSIAHVITLDILEVDDKIKFLIGVKLCYKLFLKITRACWLLVPADSCLSKVYSTYFCLEGQIGLDSLIWKELGYQ